MQHQSSFLFSFFRAQRLHKALWGLCLFFLSTMLIIAPARPAHALFGFGKFSLTDEVELGKKFDILIRSRLPLVEDPEIKNYVQGLVTRLLKAAPPQPFQFTTSVLLHPSLNAFASPGGFLFVHTGLITQVDHESELAGVLAHELAHATQRHIANRMEKMQQTSLLSMAGILAGALLGGSSGSAAVAGSLAAAQSSMLNYSRLDETEADEIGLQYLIKAGFPPKGMVGAFEAIRQKQWSSGTDIPTYLSTHPGVLDRISALSSRILKLPSTIQNRPEQDAQFLRIRTLCRARYSDTLMAEQLFKAEPADNAMTQLGFGILYDRLNRVNKARKAFDKALTLAPNDALIWREAGRFHYTKGDRDQATQMLQRATIMNPRDYMALFYYARLLADSGETAKAYTYFEDVLRYVPQDTEVHYYYGRVLGSQQNLFKAYLHFAYSALYSNNKGNVEKFIKRAKEHASTPAEEKELELFDKRYQDRAAFWS